ncbi:MAG: hypothetical protein M1831_001279 [Alyxoria varia]|nr:MAG: hypothetical protein M1831_001279 [Alyxoria varia]
MAARTLALSITLLILTATAHPYAHAHAHPDGPPISDIMNQASDPKNLIPLPAYPKGADWACNLDPKSAAQGPAVESMKPRLKRKGYVAYAKFGKGCTVQPDMTTSEARLSFCVPDMQVGESDTVASMGEEVVGAIERLQRCPGAGELVGGIVPVGGIGNFLMLDNPNAP